MPSRNHIPLSTWKNTGTISICGPLCHVQWTAEIEKGCVRRRQTRFPRLPCRLVRAPNVRCVFADLLAPTAKRLAAKPGNQEEQTKGAEESKGFVYLSLPTSLLILLDLRRDLPPEVCEIHNAGDNKTALQAVVLVRPALTVSLLSSFHNCRIFSSCLASRC